uniref:Centromere protein J C-terminal domain-containing protein n=1 Tax=viral metagenome TaxID=1070528 RepID=A0A6C0EBH1_9ZZZZ
MTAPVRNLPKDFELSSITDKIIHWEFKPDGTTDVYYLSGTLSKIYHDGTIISRNDKKLKIAFPDVDEPFVIDAKDAQTVLTFFENTEINCMNKMIRSTAPNGRRTTFIPTICYPHKEIIEKIHTTAPDGTRTLYYPSGQVVILKPDLTIQNMHPSGYSMTRHPGGFTQIVHANGDRETIYPDGTHKVIYKLDPFGKDLLESIVTTTLDDYRVVNIVYHNGSVTFVDKDGSLKIYDDGKVETQVSHPDGKVTTMLYNTQSTT